MDQLCMATESQGTAMGYIRRGMDELNVIHHLYSHTTIKLTAVSGHSNQTWEWAYGQTPEFTHTVAHAFPWGDVVRDIPCLACALD